MQGLLYAVGLVLVITFSATSLYLTQHVWQEKFVIANAPEWSLGFLGAMALALLLSLIRQMQLFGFYQREWGSLSRFVKNNHGHEYDMFQKVRDKALVRQRYSKLADLHQRDGDLDQGALAHLLQGQEDRRLSLPRFIHSILILLGVLGTMISLGVSLEGASDLLNTSDTSAGIGALMGGMATALSTTMLAIIGFILNGFFLDRLANYQKSFLGSLEETTLLYIMPKFEEEEEADPVDSQLQDLLRSLQGVAKSMMIAQQNLETSQKTLMSSIAQSSEELTGFSKRVDSINNTLKAGFRLEEH